MQKNNITFNTYSPGDEEGIVELLISVFPKWRQYKDPLNNWKWKYLKGPLPSLVIVAKDGEQIVGAEHWLVLNIKIGGSILLSRYGDDLAVNPDYRKLGIWTNLKKTGDKKQIDMGIKFQYVASNNPIVKERIINMGFYPTKHAISYFLKIRDQETFLNRQKRNNLVTRVGIKAFTVLTEVNKIFSSKLNRDEGLSVVKVAEFDDRINEFWEKVKDSYDFCIVKNADYLNWKLSRPTITKIVARLALKDNEVLGFSILELIEDGDYREGSISDLLTLPNKWDVVDALIRDACEYFDSEGVAAIYFQPTKGHPIQSVAKRNGFIDASSQNKTYFYFGIVNNSTPIDYIENLPPSRIQLNYF